MTVPFFNLSQLYTAPNLEDAVKLCRNFRVVSFDVFDTTVRRRGVFRPIDVFRLVGVATRDRLGLSPYVFANLRIRAERDARALAHATGSEEVRLRDIYGRLSDLLPTLGRLSITREEVEELAAIELEQELRLMQPVPAVLALYERLRAAGRRLVFVSDFYADASYVAKVLGACGYYGYEDLFVSSDLGLTKDRSSLFPYVVAALGVTPAAMLHVGDNPLADGNRALEWGHPIVRVNRPSVALASRLGLQQASPFAPLESAMLQVKARSLFGTPLAAQSPTDLPLAERVGCGVLGPLLLGFASWLAAEAAAHGFDTLFFCARDGRVMREAFELYKTATGLHLPTHYLCVSRQVIYRGLAAAEPAGGAELFVQNWSLLTPGDALRRWGLKPEQHAGAIAAAGFAGPNDTLVIGDRAGEAHLRALYASVADAIAEANAPLSDRLQRYLVQEGFLEAARPCLVDIGWHGSMQTGLAALLKATGCSRRLAGRYLGLFLAPGEAERRHMAGYLFSRDGTPLTKRLRVSPSLVELLHTAGHGSTIDYAKTNDGLMPLFEDRAAEMAQYAQVIAPIQKAALAFISKVLKTVSVFPPWEPVAQEVAFLGLDHLLNAPAPDEARTLGALEIAANYGEAAASIRLNGRLAEGYTLWRAGSGRRLTV